MAQTMTDDYPPMAMQEALRNMATIGAQAVEDCIEGWEVCIRLTPDGGKVIPSVSYAPPTEH